MVVANSRFIDEIIGLDWLTDALQNGLFSVLATAITKVPQTDAGVARLTGGMVQPFNQGRSNGLLAPGYWTGDPIGEVNTGDFLPNGFSSNLMNDVCSQLQSVLTFDEWYDGSDYLLFTNGVLDVETRELLPFNRELHLTQQMPSLRYWYEDILRIFHPARQ